jgi:hypothetical protein
LAWARDFWDESDPADFDWDIPGHRRVRHRATGDIYRIRLGHPVGGELESDVQTFCVRDQRLVLLGKPGSARPRTVVPEASFYGRKIEHVGGAPLEGTRIW